ncbi:hypothetical protein CHISP_0103 [Chitinispirillum alkaliphilum]|nr:hypothetical protein CHISP_0103 [Chitinispirillum alkaliphilum]
MYFITRCKKKGHFQPFRQIGFLLHHSSVPLENRIIQHTSVLAFRSPTTDSADIFSVVCRLKYLQNRCKRFKIHYLTDKIIEQRELLNRKVKSGYKIFPRTHIN